MSYDIRLVDPITKEPLHSMVPHQITGGTYAMYGTDELWLNITFNYRDKFKKAFETDNGIHCLTGLIGAEAIPILDKAISNLGDDVSDNYWESTEGNAKRALIGLKALCQMRPDGEIENDY